MKFKLQGMTSEAYGKMMLGYNGYYVSDIWVEAETKEEAYKIACEQNPELVINTYIESEEEINNHEKRVAEMIAEEKRKEREKAERKAKREQEKADEMGITIEEYKEYQRLKTNKRRHESAMESHYKAIERAKRGIEYEERKIKEYENKMKKFEKRY